MMKKVAGMGRQDHRAEKEALLVAEYYEAQRQLNEGQDRLNEKQNPTDQEVLCLLAGAVRRYERAIGAINAAGIGEKVFGTRRMKGGIC